MKCTHPAEDLEGLAQCTGQGLTMDAAGAAAGGGGVVDSQKSKSSL